MIKSPHIRGADLDARLAKHQRWVDQHAHDWDAPDRFDARPSPEVMRRRWIGDKCRMAKARLRPVSSRCV